MIFVSSFFFTPTQLESQNFYTQKWANLQQKLSFEKTADINRVTMVTMVTRVTEFSGVFSIKRSPTPWVTNISNVLSLRQPSQSSCATIWPFICQAKLVLLINYCLRSTLPGSRVSRTRFNVGRRRNNRHL